MLLNGHPADNELPAPSPVVAIKLQKGEGAILVHYELRPITRSERSAIVLGVRDCPKFSHAPGILTRKSFTEFRNTMTSGPRWMNAAWIGPIQPMRAAVMPSTCTTPTPTHKFS